MTEEKNKGMTLWEIIKDKISGGKEEPLEFNFFNPLKAKLGDFVSIETAELSGKNFTLVETDIYKRKILGENFEFANYIFREGDNWVHLRVFPLTNPEPYSYKHCDVMVVFPDFEMPYDQNFYEIILPSGILEVKDGQGNLMATYNRRENLKDPIFAEVTVIDNADNQPKIESWDCWDFERDTAQDKEYYFVEMDLKTKSFQMFWGREISEKDIIIFPSEKS